MFTGVHAGGSGVVVMDVTPMGVAVIPIFKPLDWGRGGLRRAKGRITATAAVGIAAAAFKISAAALITSATSAATIAVSTATAAIVGATTTANCLSLLALALLLATTATS